MAVVTPNQTLSDSNVVQSRSIVVSKTRPYSDLDLSLTLHPVFNDIVPLTDIDAVKNAVKVLVLTNFNERPFQPQLAGNVRGYLFEPADKFTIVALRQSIKKVIEQYEPRVDSVTVQIVDNSDENRYDVTIGFRVITLNVEVNVDLYLIRLR
jgi:phage baseplate assembly protein W